MLIAVDVGNTHIVIGVFQGTDLKHSFRLQSDIRRTVDEYALEILGLLNSVSIDKVQVSQIVVSCVVPALTRVFSKLSVKYFSLQPLIVGPGVKTGISIAVDDPRSVGADRIVNAVAARELYGAPIIVVDLGTATTFDVVSARGSYEGGVIAPGLVISADALFNRAAMLPSIELKRPHHVLGKNTVDSMLSGIVFGYAALIDGIIKRLKSDLGRDVRVVATGGLSHLIAPETEYMKDIDGDLTLKGLQIIAALNE